MQHMLGLTIGKRAYELCEDVLEGYHKISAVGHSLHETFFKDYVALLEPQT